MRTLPNRHIGDDTLDSIFTLFAVFAIQIGSKLVILA